MVFTAAQRTAFWQQPNQMGVPPATVALLAAEGISQPSDLEEFGDEAIKAIAKTIRAGGGVFAQKSVQRIQKAAKLVKYYATVGRDPTPANMRFTVIKGFTETWEYLEKKQDKDEPDTPKITKNLAIMQWSQAFEDNLSRIIGSRLIPLSYVIREEANPAGPVPDAQANRAYADIYENIEKEMIALASHDHALYQADNAEVYHKLEEATRSTSYAASIKPFSRQQNGRGAYLALIGQHAGKEKWNSVLTRMNTLVISQKWKGQGNYPLDKHNAKHRDAHKQMAAAAEHVEFQLPNGHTRVTRLMESIECGDPALQAALAQLRTDDDPAGPRYDFEKAAAVIGPADPVAKRLQAQKRPAAVAGVEAEDGSEPKTAYIASLNIKSGKGPKTGVDLRWHTLKEHNKLSKAEKDELSAWRATEEGQKAIQASKDKYLANKNKKKNNTKGENSMKAQMVSALKSIVADKEEEESGMDQLRGFVMSCIKDSKPSSSNATAASVSTETKTDGVSFLKQILKKAKNN